MATMTKRSNSRVDKIKSDLRKQKSQEAEESKKYTVATEEMDVNAKLELLKRYNREDLAELFKEEWKPRRSPAKKRGAPLDQRVTITVTDSERTSLDNEIEKIKKIGEKTSMAEIIRSRSIASIDLPNWRDRAEKALEELDDIEKNKNALQKERFAAYDMMDHEEDEDEVYMYQKRISEIDDKLGKLISQKVKRSNRLSGRMSTAEAETIKWRAQRLMISSSDYLRMMIFALEPNSISDAHLSLDAKRRFYISIIDVAENGWGDVPKIYNCSQCMNYLDLIRNLREELDKIKKFGN